MTSLNSERRTLIVMPSLTSGGAERSLISFLEAATHRLGNVELLLFQPGGLFLEALPDSVVLLDTPPETRLLYGPIGDLIRDLRFLRQPKLVTSVIFVRFLLLLSRYMRPNVGSMARAQKLWKYYRHVLPKIGDHYDVAIAYQQGHAINFVVDRVESQIKIGWMHSSYLGHGFDANQDLPYFRSLNALFAVSTEVAEELTSVFPDEALNVVVQPNLISIERVRELACATFPAVRRPKGRYILATVGRLAPQKDYPCLLTALALLREQGLDCGLYIIGEGSERPGIDALVQELGLREHVEMVGVLANPYPLVKACDVYVQSSLFEGDGLAIREARILEKPLVLAPFSTAARHVRQGFNGLITARSPGSIAQAIADVIENLDAYQANASAASTTGELTAGLGVKPFFDQLRELEDLGQPDVTSFESDSAP